MEGPLRSPADPVTAIVFDMDGTLIDSGAAVPDSYIAVIGAAGGPHLQRDDVIQRYSVGPPRVLLSHFLGRQVTDDELDAYHAVLAEKAAGAAAYPGIPETLEELQRVVPLAVFSGASVRACEILLRTAGLHQFFRAIVGGDEVGQPKPQPDGIALACRRLGVVPDRVAYVGDAPVDLEAARRCPVLAVAAAWGHQYAPEVPADVVAEHPKDLMGLVGGASFGRRT
jgi:HAD superfamily hydrolase (TIGR01549 family)